MFLKRFTHIAVLPSIPLVFSADSVRANSFGVNIYGLSYHVNDRRGEKLFTTEGRFNEFNNGFGLRASFGTDSAVTTLLVEGGAFDDTFQNLAKYLSVGFQVRVIRQLRAGINAAVYTTQSINYGNPFFAPVPIVSYTVSVVTLNFVYLPKYEPRNPWHTIGAYATIHLFRGEPSK
jgi:hypothetical protein